ncbi:Gfo/Idh/MocA family protein [Catenisphaera adipataccumulans]|jgi:predicted dehydrogenase|uniref:Putative dehydrogenase n=1 Tax=Catenisphaera adipataccumulans TaxID=700500 RepID=A0A7W8FVQ4_9FIRM|nr:Gfo/Idh/MocA family oxidoreductase [Catenisphaera adipataccumulans]MBB5183398.1 putative dehydrogenase [Catenisphaera adipataccumulans]
MKIAMIGTGFIVPVTLQALAQINSITVTSIFARPHSIEKGRKIAADHAIPTVYTDYAQLLAEDDCDFVYIANINKVHFEYAKQALEAGKNVVLEKPSCVQAAQIKTLAELAEAKHLYIFEAVTSLHNPNFHHIQEDMKTIGQIKVVQCNYSQYSSRYNAYKEHIVKPALDPKCYGGALMDINIYNLNVIVSLFGKPQSVRYLANIGFNGVDTSGTVIMRYPDFYALATGAKDSESPGHVTIQGDLGYIDMKSPTNAFSYYDLYYNETKKATRHAYNQYEHRMVHEFLEFEEVFRNKDYDTMRHWLQTSIEVMEVVDAAAADAHLFEDL